MQPGPEFAGMVHEHICLSSEEEPQQAARPASLPMTGEAVLEQSHARGACRIVIFDGTFLGVCTRRPGGSSEYWLNMAFVDPSPVRRMNKRWCNLCVGLTLLSSAALSLHFHPAAEWPAGWGAALLVGPAAAFISLGVAIHRYFDRLEFLTRHGRVPVLRIFRSKSDRSDLANFLELLANASAKALALRAVDRRQFLRDELQEHRRLHQQGALAAEQFEAAKTAILRQHR